MHAILHLLWEHPTQLAIQLLEVERTPRQAEQPVQLLQFALELRDVLMRHGRGLRGLLRWLKLEQTTPQSILRLLDLHATELKELSTAQKTCTLSTVYCTSISDTHHACEVNVHTQAPNADGIMQERCMQFTSTHAMLFPACMHVCAPWTITLCSDLRSAPLWHPPRALAVKTAALQAMSLMQMPSN